MLSTRTSISCDWIAWAASLILTFASNPSLIGAIRSRIFLEWLIWKAKPLIPMIWSSRKVDRLLMPTAWPSSTTGNTSRLGSFWNLLRTVARLSPGFAGTTGMEISPINSALTTAAIWLLSESTWMGISRHESASELIVSGVTSGVETDMSPTIMPWAMKAANCCGSSGLAK